MSPGWIEHVYQAYVDGEDADIDEVRHIAGTSGPLCLANVPHTCSPSANTVFQHSRI